MALAPMYLIIADAKRQRAYKVTPVVRERMWVNKERLIESSVKLTAAGYSAVDLDEVLRHEAEETAVVLRVDGDNGAASLPGFEKDAEELL
ncbi:hypothetical protein [Methanocella sp. MCL-LM]|uniref:hypothetical protein n=1 Tax=Methanocella sp. MCL-LM TaxID=3412035 RepID=UPI003C71B3D8